MSTRRCFKCQGLGHIASKCPNHEVITFTVWRAVDKQEKEGEIEGETEEEHKESQEEVEEEADEGEMLVLRRVLNCQKSTKDEQRENIFHTRCTVQGKVCLLIIDGGSSANVVSLTTIEKLGLQTMAHPHPYNIQWMNQSKGLQVNSRCLITLSIGKNYQNLLWCDVTPMDAYHVLLGRPWMFDRRVTHDGFLNTYSLSKGGKKIALKPLSLSELLKSKLTKGHDHSGCLLTFSETLLRASNHEFKAFKEWILTLQDEPESLLPTHPLAKSLIQTFCHLLPEEIPSGLPPKRDIQHHIDLIPSSVLPNKPAYRMNPKETLEIQRQVDELMSKGLVREYLSPYPYLPCWYPRKMAANECVWTVEP